MHSPASSGPWRKSLGGLCLDVLVKKCRDFYTNPARIVPLGTSQGTLVSHAVNTR